MADSQVVTPRRGTRIRKPTIKSVDNENLRKLRLSGILEVVSSSDDEEEMFQRPEIDHSMLKHNDGVQGDIIYPFPVRKTRNKLLEKAKECQEFAKQMTPQQDRNRIKKALKRQMEELENQDDPFSDSGSEYKGSEDSDTDSDKSNSSDSSSDSESYHKESRRKNSQFSKISHKIEGKLKIENTIGIRTRRNNKYTIKTDDYFCNQATKKIVTSDHTLDKLETPRLAQDELQKLLKNMKLSKNHKKCMKQIYEQNKSNFAKWLYVLHENFNILLYGLGSKRNIIEDFCTEFLHDSPVIVVNGFFPSLSIKDILDGIIVDLLELKRNPSNVYECCDIIEQEFRYLDTHLYLVVHNIDGDMLRNSKSQSVLARLASIENIHLIASIDHINAPLMWDHSKLNKFNYTWWDTTSFLPYIDETSFESSMMIQKSGEFALSSLRNVFLSLTSNSKGIYLLILKHQLTNCKNPQYQGLAFKDLYSSCREAFLVSSDLALRAQLTEFVDHKMVKFRRSTDGVEYLIIPISNALLQKFLDEQRS